MKINKFENLFYKKYNISKESLVLSNFKTSEVKNRLEKLKFIFYETKNIDVAKQAIIVCFKTFTPLPVWATKILFENFNKNSSETKKNDINILKKELKEQKKIIKNLKIELKKMRQDYFRVLVKKNK